MFWTEYILFGITTLGVIFAVYRTFKQPDDDAKLHIAVIDVRLEALDKTVAKIASNDLPHMDALLRDVHDDAARHNTLVAENFAKIFAILDERIPRK